MSFPEFKALARHLDGSDPADRAEQSYNLDRLHELCEYVRRRNGPKLAACLDATAQLIEALAGPGEHIERSSVHGIACRLLATVEQALGNSTPPGQEKLAQKTVAPLELQETPATVASEPKAKATEQPAPPRPDSSALELAKPPPASRTTPTPAPTPAPVPVESAPTPVEDEPQPPSLTPRGDPELPLINNMVFGRLIVELGYATRAQVARALKMHRAKGLPVGECLLLSGSTSPDLLLETLKLQELMREMADAPDQPAPASQARPQPETESRPSSSGSSVDSILELTNDMVFGRLIVQLGYATRIQVAHALKMHRSMGLPVGECLLLNGSTAPEQLLEALKFQEQMRAMASPPAQPAADSEAHDAPQAQGLEPEDASLRVTKQMFFGEVLLGMSMITKNQLEEAMHVHHFEGVRVGEALVGMGVLTQEDVERGLELQHCLLHAAGLSSE